MPLHTDVNACAIILAGGQGSRVRDLHPDLPKPMFPAGGAPFLEWVIRYLAGQGVRSMVISLGHLAPVVERYLAGRPADGLSIRSVREPGPLGTGGAIRFASREAAGANLLVAANGDSLVLA